MPVRLSESRGHQHHHHLAMAASNQNIYFEMDFSPGDENEIMEHSELEVDPR